MNEIPFISDQIKNTENLTITEQFKYFTDGSQNIIGSLWNWLLNTIKAYPEIAVALVIVFGVVTILSIGNNKASSWISGIIGMLLLIGIIFVMVYMIK